MVVTVNIVADIAAKYAEVIMTKDRIIETLKKRGCRITKQRVLIIDVILENECSCCKEIYYKASQIDRTIGIATVYRLVNTLEAIGAISRKNMYKVAFSEQCDMKNACTVVLDDDTTYNLSAKSWNTVIKAGLSACGYLKNQKVFKVIVKECECESISC